MRNLALVPFLLLVPACSFFMGKPQPSAEPQPAAQPQLSAEPQPAEPQLSAEPQPADEPSATGAAVASAPIASSEPGPAPTAAATAEPEAPAPEASKTFSLVEHKLPLSIELPKDAKVEASQSRDGLGGVRIWAYPTVSLRIVKADARLASIRTAKATLKKMENPAKTFFREEKDLLVYDREDDEMYFLMLVKIGGVTYSCQDLGGEPDDAALEPGIAACRSLKKAP